jgi:hypothetical protein
MGSSHRIILDWLSISTDSFWYWKSIEVIHCRSNRKFQFITSVLCPPFSGRATRVLSLEYSSLRPFLERIILIHQTFVAPSWKWRTRNTRYELKFLVGPAVYNRYWSSISRYTGTGTDTWSVNQGRSRFDLIQQKPVRELHFCCLSLVFG